ncbi:MAG: hypothetical protein DI617_07510 [Streptococcus pyogenes]|nr:MAG: hypothetical protein DI617_07510 [Streptococcus pyogenes]
MELQQPGQAAPRMVHSKGCSSKQELHRTSKALTGKKVGLASQTYHKNTKGSGQKRSKPLVFYVLSY